MGPEGREWLTLLMEGFTKKRHIQAGLLRLYQAEQSQEHLGTRRNNFAWAVARQTTPSVQPYCIHKDLFLFIILIATF